MTSKNYYKILEVHPLCSYDEIRKAYRKKALAHHPDISSENENLFLDVKEAYTVLINPTSRIKYHKAFFNTHLQILSIDDAYVQHQLKLIINYINNTNSYERENVLIALQINELLQSTASLFSGIYPNKEKAHHIIEELLFICRHLSYSQILLFSKQLINNLPYINNELNQLLSRKKKIQFWDNYKIVFALLVAAMLCIAIAFMS